MRNEQVEKTVDMQLGANPDTANQDESPTLVVVSKIKSFIRQNGGMNTSQDAVEALSRKVAEEAMRAIEKAKEAGRKTVMGRDFIG